MITLLPFTHTFPVAGLHTYTVLPFLPRFTGRLPTILPLRVLATVAGSLLLITLHVTHADRCLNSAGALRCLRCSFSLRYVTVGLFCCRWVVRTLPTLLPHFCLLPHLPLLVPFLSFALLRCTRCVPLYLRCHVHSRSTALPVTRSRVLPCVPADCRLGVRWSLYVGAFPLRFIYQHYRVAGGYHTTFPLNCHSRCRCYVLVFPLWCCRWIAVVCYLPALVRLPGYHYAHRRDRFAGYACHVTHTVTVYVATFTLYHTVRTCVATWVHTTLRCSAVTIWSFVTLLLRYGCSYVPLPDRTRSARCCVYAVDCGFGALRSARSLRSQISRIRTCVCCDFCVVRCAVGGLLRCCRFCVAVALRGSMVALYARFTLRFAFSYRCVAVTFVATTRLLRCRTHAFTYLLRLR